MATKVHRTVVTIEILHPEDIPIDGLTISDIAFEVDGGDCSGRILSRDTSPPLTPGELVRYCGFHGTDPDFFGSDSDEQEEPEGAELDFENGDFTG